MTLAHRIEAAEGADRALDGDIAEHLGLVPPWVSKRLNPRWATWSGGRDYWDAPAYTASIDAALTLVPEGCEWIVEAYTSNGVKAEHVRASAWVSGAPRCFAATPALALCAAALKTRIERNEG